jgi:hypothetical protein
LLGSHGASLAALLGGPIKLFASAGHRTGALFKDQSAGVAEIGPVLLLDPPRVGDVAAAKPEGVGRARPSAPVCRNCPVQRQVVAQSNAASTSIPGRLVFEIMLDHSCDDLEFFEAGLRKKPEFQRLAALTKS